jgi:hypothetical protein
MQLVSRFLVLALALAAACGGSTSFPDAAAPPDAATADAASADAAPGSPDAAVTTYNDMTQAPFWSAFDLTTVQAGAKGFEGAAFDGRYLYFVPYTQGQSAIVTRYDTQASFASGASYTTFDTTTLAAGARGFAGGVFDGRYIYLVPRFGGGDVVARYDTQGAFGNAAAWATFTTTTADPAASGFVGGAFDGRYVYLVPYNNASNAYHGVVTRYDTQAAFTAAGSWSTFDTTTVDAGAKGFYGAVFDGRYLYLVPWIRASGTYHGLVARYDTQAPFATKASWSTFDTATVDAAAAGFSGGAFDGRYLYLVPGHGGVTARYDTTMAFASAAAWSTYDLTKVAAGAYGFTGATFDGRYIYFAPYASSTYDGLVARYDTLAPFAAAGSWATFDTTAVNPAGVGFIGAIFDGRAVYLVPCTSGSYHGVVLRFDAKAPPSMPAIYGSSPVGFWGSFL